MTRAARDVGRRERMVESVGPMGGGVGVSVGNVRRRSGPAHGPFHPFGVLGCAGRRAEWAIRPMPARILAGKLAASTLHPLP